MTRNQQASIRIFQIRDTPVLQQSVASDFRTRCQGVKISFVYYRQIGNSVIGEIKVNESAFKNQVMEETCQSMLNFEHQLKTNIPM
jgi:hypothetical protein